ncbi:histone-lysine N-methyltransferase SETMAR-like [Parasteatoda tepidariorum]|uniref:histone-lysine N-methyltransferase SETMAR-like n=1 Tax=Parasteatoda tepidariorum TaxID=114398 RepID=UPI001C718682|nr:histone-lysine N-methyltransferase SETMAR-like [Parasteatoda tepidariorum]
MDKTKMRVIFEHEFCHGTNAAQTSQNVNEVLGKDAAKELTVLRWFIKFRSGDFDLQSEPRGRSESKVDDNQLKAVMEANPSETTSELVSRFEVTIPTILSHVKAIGKVKKKQDKCVSHEMSERHQRNCSEACCSLVSRLRVRSIFAPDSHVQ